MSTWSARKVDEAGFSSRTRGVLIRDLRGPNCFFDDWGPLTTMGNVAALTDRQLLGRPGFGLKALAEVHRWFDEHGVSR